MRARTPFRDLLTLALLLLGGSALGGCADPRRAAGGGDRRHGRGRFPEPDRQDRLGPSGLGHHRRGLLGAALHQERQVLHDRRLRSSPNRRRLHRPYEGTCYQVRGNVACYDQADATHTSETEVYQYVPWAGLSGLRAVAGDGSADQAADDVLVFPRGLFTAARRTAAMIR